jgi:hypothetical protein
MLIPQHNIYTQLAVTSTPGQRTILLIHLLLFTGILLSSSIKALQMKVLRCSNVVMSTILLIHLLLFAGRAQASPTIFFPGNNAQESRHGARRLLQLQPEPATATNTFHVKGGGVHQARTTPANAKPNVEFNASMRRAPRSNSNPRQN